MFFLLLSDPFMYSISSFLPINKNYQGNDDSSLLTAVMNPLMIKLPDKTEVWSNLKPQSPLFTRPFFIKFAKETTDIVNSKFTLIVLCS